MASTLFCRVPCSSTSLRYTSEPHSWGGKEGEASLKTELKKSRICVANHGMITKNNIYLTHNINGTWVRGAFVWLVWGLYLLELSSNKNSSNKLTSVRILMDVSKIRGTPKSSILIGFSIINHSFWGPPLSNKPRCHTECFKRYVCSLSKRWP